jgi:hypothetical protein
MNYVEPSPESKKILCEIDGYIDNIRCEKIMGKGSIDDYKVLFQKVFEYSDELASQKITLDMDMKKLDNFADSAEQLTENISNLTIKLKSIIAVNDIKFLNDFKDKVRKISKLYETIEEFQKTIIESSELYIPTTLEKVNNKLCKIIQEIDKSMIYLDNFTEIVENKIVPNDASISNITRESVQKTCDSLDARKKYINCAHPPDNFNKYMFMIIYIFIIIIILTLAYIYKYKYMTEMLVLITILLLMLLLLLL